MAHIDGHEQLFEGRLSSLIKQILKFRKRGSQLNTGIVRIPQWKDFAPAGGADQDEFQTDARRLEKFGVCRSVYAFNRLQGGEYVATRV
jgi:hypothetical protein